MNPDSKYWKGRKVFITGHTGFKGSWLSCWLLHMGAEVHGYALNPPTEPNIFDEVGLVNHLASHTINDIRDSSVLAQTLLQIEPEIVFHLAAQPLVRYSYDHPVDTFSTNVMGCVNLFDAIRKTPSVHTVVSITTDKCYENKEWIWGYRENEPLGGSDPYSGSKACAEIVSNAYRQSYFSDSKTELATARAGNVIGGGDWATDRLIPDFLRAVDKGDTLFIRSPTAIRPWQHVLEPLSGYLLLAEKLSNKNSDYANAWNFGPNDDDAKPVQWIVETLIKLNGHGKWQTDNSKHVHEAHYLHLDSSKARTKLNWLPKWDLHAALNKTLEWHNAWKGNSDMFNVTIEQIKSHQHAR